MSGSMNSYQTNTSRAGRPSNQNSLDRRTELDDEVQRFESILVTDDDVLHCDANLPFSGEGMMSFTSDPKSRSENSRFSETLLAPPKKVVRIRQSLVNFYKASPENRARETISC